MLFIELNLGSRSVEVFCAIEMIDFTPCSVEQLLWKPEDLTHEIQDAQPPSCDIFTKAFRKSLSTPAPGTQRLSSLHSSHCPSPKSQIHRQPQTCDLIVSDVNALQQRDKEGFWLFSQIHAEPPPPDTQRPTRGTRQQDDWRDATRSHDLELAFVRFPTLGTIAVCLVGAAWALSQ